MDKREAVRIPVRVRAQCRTSTAVVDGFVEDVSKSGVFLRVACPETDEGETAEIDLELPGEEPLRLEARVVRVDDTGIALRFAERSRELANFIMRQHQSRS
ncbi:MAG TPA: PilZ domain-containing protein [Kofleriaceae bacterium]